jgi:hypothetical protein
VLYHHGIAGAPADLRTLAGRQFLGALDLRADARERILVALEMIDLLEIQIARIERDLKSIARRQTGCKALMGIYGIGELTSLVCLTELGDVSRMHASRQAVRCAGIDIGVHRSDRKARLGKLTRQGSADLRWALYEAAQSACRSTSPDREDYLALKARGLSHTRASLTIARNSRAAATTCCASSGPPAWNPSPPKPPSFRPLFVSSDQAHISPMSTQASGQLPQLPWHPHQPPWRPTKDRAAGVAPPERPINHLVTDPTGRGPR